MTKSNPVREIAWSLTAAVVFGVGFYVYLSRTMPVPEPSKLLVASAADGAAGEGKSRAEVARRVATAFAQQLAAGKYEDAYGMMARAYRQTVTLDGFRVACAASPFLSTVTGVSLSRMREERAAGDIGAGSLSGVGVLMSRSGTVDTTFFFVDDPGGVAIVNVVAAGTSALPLH